MNPKIWGPHAWIFLHTITLNYPENPTPEQKKQYKKFFESLADVIPCDKCKYNYIKKIKKNPVNVESRMELVQWLLNIHNEVNVSNEKSPLSMKEFIKKYREMYSIDDETSNKEYIKVDKKYLNYTIILIIIILIFSFFRKK
jgi:ATP-dependent Zn protease